MKEYIQYNVPIVRDTNKTYTFVPKDLLKKEKKSWLKKWKVLISKFKGRIKYEKEENI